MAGVLFHLDSHRSRREGQRFERRFALVFLDVEALAQLRQWNAAVLLHGMYLYRLLLHELQAGGTPVSLSLIARFLRVEVLRARVERADAAGAAQFGPLVPDIGAGGGKCPGCASPCAA